MNRLYVFGVQFFKLEMRLQCWVIYAVFQELDKRHLLSPYARREIIFLYQQWDILASDGDKLLLGAFTSLFAALGLVGFYQLFVDPLISIIATLLGVQK